MDEVKPLSTCNMFRETDAKNTMDGTYKKRGSF